MKLLPFDKTLGVLFGAWIGVLTLQKRKYKKDSAAVEVWE